LKSSAIRCASLVFLFFILLALGATGPAYPASRAALRTGGFRIRADVQSMADIRWRNLTRQGWDMSCGAAALSTLLIYHHGRQFTEMAVTLTILKNTDPAVVRKRGGFSLYDLKRFVRAIGLDGVGYGDMTLDDLALFDMPAILPVRLGDLDHFVIFRKRVGEHVLLGDPAFGNISLSAARFEKMWKSRIAFYVVSSVEKEVMARQESARSMSPLSPDIRKVAMADPYYSTRILARIPAVPLTRRINMVAP